MPVDGLWKYFEEHDPIFTALIAFIVGVIAYLGARAQAKGGRAQAEAAREAATIAAEAQRVAALWTVRQSQLAEFVRSARRLKYLSERLWIEDDEALAETVSRASEEMSLLWAEVQLTGTEAVVEASGELAMASLSVEATAQEYAPVLHVREALRRMTSNNVSLGEEVQRILALTDSSNEEDLIGRLREAVPSFSLDQAYHVVVNGRVALSEMVEERQSANRVHNVAVSALMREARVMLRSDDDVVPAASRRRRWRRRAT